MKRRTILPILLVLASVNSVYAIEVNSNITTNQIWTANNTYHVTAAVNVTALLVIEPGTSISFSSSGGLIVNNGGTLISAGTPNSQIHYTSDAGYGWGDYNCAIEIQETASPATKIIYNYIDCANIAILTKNIQLDTPIQNNILFYNNLGIKEYGTHHTDILNNLIYYGYNDYYYSYCISIYMESTTGGADANSSILIENNTCDYQDYGIMVRGTANINNMGQAKLINNIVSESAEYGICIVNGYISETVSNTGYYGNSINQYGYDVARESNTVVTTVNPFDAAGWHLVNGCPFINAGKEYIEQTPLIGTTTNVNGTPDSNKIDIGYHYANWNYSNAGTTTLRADFDNNYKVDYKDLRFFANYWLFDYNEAEQTWLWDYDNSGKVDMPDLRVVSGYWLSPFNFYDFADFANQWQKKVDERYYDSRPDLNNDKIVNFKDFAILANEWRKTAEGNPVIMVSVSGDVNNIVGSFEVDVNSSDFAGGYNFIFMDGQLIAPMQELGGQITIDSYRFRNGIHSLKVVHSGLRGIIISVEKSVTFNNPIYCLNIEDHFNTNSHYRISGLHDGSNTLNVEIKNIYDQVIWSGTDSGVDVNIVVPGTVFGSENICAMTISEISSGGMMGFMEKSGTLTDTSNSSPAPPVEEISLTRKFDANACPNVKAVIILPDTDVFTAKKPAILACAQAFQNRLGVGLWTVLYYHDVTPTNLNNLFSRPGLKYIYWSGHANSHVGRNERAGIPGVQRTNTYCWRLVSEHTFWWDTYEQIGAFSFTAQTFSGYPTLPSNWDYRGFDLWGIRMSDHSDRMADTSNKKIVFVDGCLSALFTDMAQAYGVFSLQGASSLDQIYIGWDIATIPSSEPIGEWFLGDTVNGIKMFWERMGTYSSMTNNVWAAFHYVEVNGSSQTRKTLFGLNSLFDGGDGDDHIRIMGRGGVNLNQIRLEP
ncbi:MAG: hypothetical protein ABR969_06465 [Sedimentisphaerales bacterium]|jgi:hypothetical protein